MKLLDYLTQEDRISSLAEFLYQSPFDELGEIDLLNDRCLSLAHVDGKYFLPVQQGSFQDLFHYAMDHLVYPDDRSLFQELMDPATLLNRLKEATVPGALSSRFRLRLMDGTWQWAEMILLSGASNGLAEGIIRLFVFDIQNQKNRELGKVASSTPLSEERNKLTGLLQQNSFLAAVREKLLHSPCEEYCFIAIDIEHFKLFNEWFGREAGDLLLADIGARLKEMPDTLSCYLNQDDFCAFLPYDPKRIDGLYTAIHEYVVSRGCTFGFLPAIGIALMDKGLSVLDLMDRALLATSSVKGDFRRRINLFQPSMLRETEQDYRILMDIQRGLRDHEFFFVLQPQCRISNHRIVGAESLTRWRTPDGRVISPAFFIPILEKYGFVTSLDQYIWDSVCQWLQKWMSLGHTPVPVSVNVSQIDIFSMNVPAYLEQLTNRYGIPHKYLKVEITESAYAENTVEIKEAVHQLQDLGFMVMMDDFGSGYSSLNMLSQLSVDVLKVDAQFLHMEQEESEERGIHILESVVSMAKTMGIPIIVEGVETAAQTSFLHDLGCRYIQGYHFYRPMQVSDFEALISREELLERDGIVFNATQQFRLQELLDQNVYSDTMLNNILGGIAVYSRSDPEGKAVDIIRYNEQFYEVVNVPDFKSRIRHIERFIHPLDLDNFYGLLDQAEKDHLNGASGLLGIYRTDGSLGYYLLRFYYLEKNEGSRKYYGVIQDLTPFVRLQKQMGLLARFSPETIIFLHRHENVSHFQVAVHGLEHVLEMTAESLQSELNARIFSRRLHNGKGSQLCELIASAVTEGKNLDTSFRMNNNRHETVHLHLTVTLVHDEYSDVEYILFLRPCDNSLPASDALS